MRQVIWSKPASKELDQIVSYLAGENEYYANLVGDRIDRAAANLADFAIGRFGRVQDTYELVVSRTPYILAYELTDTTVTILHVVHGARDWQDGGWPDQDELR